MQPKGQSQGQSQSQSQVKQQGLADPDLDLADFDDADAGFDAPPQFQEKLLDADFFNQFPDDFDESDMEIPK
ncbi:hypothetical protein CHLRE_02g102150v5 [Chlamydomonas reinhardtii]|uniref:Uncharacterized protein n=1 Tax=Chlamydomonas reinhardtii TaxID=3055 RepID=A8I4P7_CHLRE|nr:uncharacterized protein CHLRE_02g102150v5 [Chlamydomonas reinhardtii]PNW86938.1 hypothetical protein CHLRE_02g102150v5 [Chlamydomonas reinhardtii]|eukprot:XP_001700007.1 predicted protein [Chlamydomonas reinhardtii]